MDGFPFKIGSLGPQIPNCLKGQELKYLVNIFVKINYKWIYNYSTCDTITLFHAFAMFWFSLIRMWNTYWLLVRIGLIEAPVLLIRSQSWYMDSKIDSTTCFFSPGATVVTNHTLFKVLSLFLFHLTNQLLFFIRLLILICHLDIGLQQAFCKHFNTYNSG